MENEFEQLEKEFESMDNQEDEMQTPQPSQKQTNSEDELSLDDLSFDSYIKNPEVGGTITFVLDRIVNNPNTKGKNKETGEEFKIGCVKKDGSVIRRDLISKDNERYTVSNWSIFYKLFGQDSDLLKLAKIKGSMKNIEISITKNLNGQFYMMKPDMIAKLEDISLEEAQELKAKVVDAVKNGTLYTIKVKDLDSLQKEN